MFTCNTYYEKVINFMKYKYYNCNREDLYHYLELLEIYPVVTNSTNNGTLYKYIWDDTFEVLKNRFYSRLEFDNCIKIRSLEYCKECMSNGQTLLSVRKDKLGGEYVYVLNKRMFNDCIEECFTITEAKSKPKSKSVEPSQSKPKAEPKPIEPSQSIDDMLKQAGIV